MDLLEKVYLMGFPLLLGFTSVFPLLVQWSSKNMSSTGSVGNPSTIKASNTHNLEFLPLMLTSMYCSVGLIWSFLRLGFIYLNEEKSYRGQLSDVK